MIGLTFSPNFGINTFIPTSNMNDSNCDSSSIDLSDSNYPTIRYEVSKYTHSNATVSIPINNKSNGETKSDLNVMAYGGG